MPDAGGLLVLAEDRLFRECLAATLEECGRYDMPIETASPHEGPERCLERQPALVLVDFYGESSAALGVIAELRSRLPKLRIVATRLPDRPSDILPCVKAGVSGYLTTRSSVGDLHETIELVLAGGVACPPEVAYSVFSELGELGSRRRRRKRLEAMRLSHREIEILQLISAGLSNREIADKLCLSFHTVKNHVHHILSKLEVRHRRAAVAKARRHRWLESVDPPTRDPRE